MIDTFYIISLTSIFSGLITIIIAYAFFKIYLEKKIYAEIDKIGSLIESRVKKGVMEGFSQVIDERKYELGQLIEAHVSKGIMAGITSIPSTEVIKGTTKTIAKTGADIVKGMKPNFW
ncbi:MAG: hypothetical protein HQK76_00345 [Desulfobacterales bacterium]|nr:hypothetical protein [Desulfobacterales bacterium]